jgi:hypothetical protein
MVREEIGVPQLQDRAEKVIFKICNLFFEKI